METQQAERHPTTTTKTNPPTTTARCATPIDSRDGGRNDSRMTAVKERLKGPWNWNKIGIGAGAAAAVAGAAYAARRYSGGSEEGEDDFQLRLETDENLFLISSKKVEGTPVLDFEGTRIGTIDNFMVDKYTGRVAYAVMSFGGMFGFGSSLFPLPWPLLEYDEEKSGYVLDISKEEMKDAPRFEASDEPEFSADFRRRIILFYRPV